MKWRKKEFWELLAARRFSPWGLVHTETSFKVSAIYFIFFCYYMNAASSRTDVSRASYCPRVITSLNSTPAFRLFPHAHLCRDDAIAPPTPHLPLCTHWAAPATATMVAPLRVFIFAATLFFISPSTVCTSSTCVLCVFFSAFLTRLPGSVRAPLTGLECATALSVVSGEKNQYRGLLSPRCWQDLRSSVLCRSHSWMVLREVWKKKGARYYLQWDY